MPARSRRYLIYALLLVLPALAVGGGALGLLWREQARLNEQTLSAQESRRAAIEARARLVAENIELLITDVQTDLMEVLLSYPADIPAEQLAAWGLANPLVHSAFRLDSSGRPLPPSPPDSSPILAWWRTSFRPEPPPASPAPFSSPDRQPASAPLAPREFSSSLPAPAPAPPTTRYQITEAADDSRRQSNVSQVGILRNLLREEARFKAEESPTLGLTAFPETSRAASPQSEASPPTALGYLQADTDALAPAPASAPARRFRTALESTTFTAAPAPPPPHGWSLFHHPDTDTPHLYGWREVPGLGWLGLELALDPLRQRLAEVLPRDLQADESYALQPLDQPPSPRLVAALLLPDTVLPGWAVVGFWNAPDLTSSPLRFFLPNAFLVAISIAAILSAGFLLIAQARRSESDALQKTSFVANVSHEFKTPLTTIRLYAELLEQGRVPDPSKQRAHLLTIGRETDRLARLVNNVLDFSRLEQGRRRYQTAPLDLSTFLASLLDAHAPRLAESGLTLQPKLPPAPLTLTTDRDALEQIVLNLLDNACKYAADGHDLTVTLTPSTPGATLEVADRGPGIPPSHRERIFEKFHRIDDSLTAARPGTGLGLAIARQLARGLGGDLTCAERPGGGTRFLLTLPS